MVQKVIGYDGKGNKVFERDAREYDKSIGNNILGISIGDIVKTVPVIFLAGMVYMHQQNFNEQILQMVNNNSQAIEGMKNVLDNLNNYLSATTGKQFHNGEPG